MSKLGVAVVGASARATMILDYLRRNADEGFVTGVYDPLPARAAFLIAQYRADGAVVYESLEQAVADPRAQAVFVATWDCGHVEPSVAALRAGKHVYCEKPMATTLADCDALVEAARGAAGIFYLGMNLRHSPVYEKLHEVVSRGQLGKLLTIGSEEFYYMGKTYFRRWNRFRKFSGGLWITKACHDFDLLNWFAGGQPTRVFATVSLGHYKPRPGTATYCRICSLRDECPDCYVPESPVFDELRRLTEEATGQPRDLCLYNSDKDTFDNGIAVVEYDNDIRATHTLNVVSARTTRRMNLVGTEGSAEGDLESGLVTVWQRHTGQKMVYDMSAAAGAAHGGGDDRALRDFFRCCRTGAKPRSSWADGRLSVAVGLAATRSSDTGQPVSLSKLSAGHEAESRV